MVKQFTCLLAGLLTAGGAFTASAESVGTLVMGGANGDKQLYGVHCPNEFAASFYGKKDKRNSGVVKIGSEGFEWESEAFGSPVFSAVYTGDRMFVAFYNAASASEINIRHAWYDTKTWTKLSEVSYSQSTPNVLPYGMTYDKTTGTVFGSFFLVPGHYLPSSTGEVEDNPKVDDAQLGYLTGDDANPVKIIGSLPFRMRALACDKDGQLYGFSYDGYLYRINKVNAKATLVRKINLPVYFPEEQSADFCDGPSYGHESMVIDPETDDFYLMYGDKWENTYIAKFKAESGDPVWVADYNSSMDNRDCDVFTGLFFEDKSSETTITPEQVTNMTVTAVGTELKAHITFTAPTKDTHGNALGNNLTYRITDGEHELATGSTSAGAEVSTDVTVSHGGNQSFAAYIDYEGNASRPVYESAFIGPDTPVIEGRPIATGEGTTVTISWEPAHGLNGGNLDNVRYQVYRLPDNVTVTQGTTETSVTNQLPGIYKEYYEYRVVPVAGSLTGEAVVSEGNYFGEIYALPFHERFTDYFRFRGYGMVDGNRDFNTWDVDMENTCAMFIGNERAADDYLLVGPLRLTAGQTYNFRIEAGCGGETTERLGVLAGTDMSDLSTFKTVIADTEFLPEEGMRELRERFTPEKAGDYYFALHATSDAYSQRLNVNELEVSEWNASVPAAPEVTDINCNFDKVTLTVKLPSETSGGAKLEQIDALEIYRDAVLINTIVTDVAPGAVVEYEDDSYASDGNHLYRVMATNAAGNGDFTEVNVWRGVDYPGAPSNLRVYEDIEGGGKVRISFDAPQKGSHGGYINTNGLQYRLTYRLGKTAPQMVDLGPGTTHVYVIPSVISGQEVFEATIMGKNDVGYDETAARTSVCIVGEPIAIPYTESWANGNAATAAWGSSPVDANGASWSVSKGESSIAPQDADGGMMLLKTTADDAAARQLTPRFECGNNANASVSFYYYATDNAKELNLELIDADKPVATLAALDLAKRNEWVKAEFDLTPYVASKYLEVCITGRGDKTGVVAAVDNFKVSTESGVHSVGDSALAIAAGKGHVTIFGGNGENVDVYTLGGVRVASAKAEGAVSINLAAGVYVVRAGGKTAKVQIR